MTRRLFFFLLLLVGCFGCGGGGGNDFAGGPAPVPPAPIPTATTPVPTPTTGSIVGRLVNLTVSAQGQSQSFTVTIQGSTNSAAVGADGNFLLVGVSPGPQTLVFSNSTDTEGAVIICEVFPGQTTSVGLVAPRPVGFISGVVNGQGEGGERPLAGAVVSATPIVDDTEPVSQLGNGRPHLVTFTGTSGEFTLRGLLPGRYLVTASRRGFFDGRQSIVVEARRAVAVNFVLRPAPDTSGSIAGLIETETGSGRRPVAAAFISLTESNPITPGPPGFVPGNPGTVAEVTVGGGGGGSLPSPPEPGIPPVRAFFTTSDDSGRYRLEGVPAGNYTLNVFKEGFAGQNRTVTVVSSQTLPADFVLINNSGSVAGQVQSTAGAPLAEAGIFFLPDDPFGVIPAGGGTVEPSTVSADANGLALFPPTRFFATTDREGRYAARVEAGNYNAVASAAGHQSQRLPVSVSVGQTSTLNFQLTPGDDPGPTDPIPIPLPAPVRPE